MHIMSGVMKPLQTLFGRHEQAIGAEPDADIAVVRRRVAARVHAPAYLDDVGAQGGLGVVMRVRARYLSRHTAEQK